jgi:hypothetical protein
MGWGMNKPAFKIFSTCDLAEATSFVERHRKQGYQTRIDTFTLLDGKKGYLCIANRLDHVRGPHQMYHAVKILSEEM